MKFLYWICLVLVVVGALNWGLIGAFQLNLVGFIFGSMPVLARIAYSIVGLAGLLMIFMTIKIK